MKKVADLRLKKTCHILTQECFAQNLVDVAYEVLEEYVINEFLLFLNIKICVHLVWTSLNPLYQRMCCVKFMVILIGRVIWRERTKMSKVYRQTNDRRSKKLASFRLG